jgi:hypothetical protein
MSIKMKTLVVRIGLTFLGIVIGTRLYYDPYTLHAAPDMPFYSPPVWRSAVVLFEFGLLLFYIYFIWGKRYLHAFFALGLATLINLCLNTGIVLTSGLDRFRVVFGTDETLSIYLAFTTLRVATLMLTIGAAITQTQVGSFPHSGPSRPTL